VIHQSELKQRIIYEDNHLIAVNKKAGWLVQGDKTGDVSLVEALKIYVKVTYNKPGEVFLGSIHRLDRPVTGLVIFARTSKALERMNLLFSSRDIVKNYLALVEGRTVANEGKLEHYLLKDPKTNTVRAFNTTSKYPKEAKLSILSYEVKEKMDKMSLLNVYPHTGRSHQIRVQLSSLRCPILGDIKYGASRPLPDMSIALHSASLEFIHPVKKEILKIEAPLPDNKWWHI